MTQEICNFEAKLKSEKVKEFNTSGPNIAEQHYTIERTGLINKGIKLVEKE